MMGKNLLINYVNGVKKKMSGCGELDLLPRELQPAFWRDYIDEQAKEENEKKEYGAYTRITNKVWKDNRTAEIIYLED